MNAQLLPPPEPLDAGHDCEGFDCGLPTIDAWLRNQALRNEVAGASRTNVIAVDRMVVAFYSLSAFSLQRSAVTGRVRRNMPDPIPAILIGRLAVDQSLSEQGIGTGLLRDALLRCQDVSNDLSARVVAVEAISSAAARYYEERGFESSRTDPLLLTVLIKDTEPVKQFETRSRYLF